MYARLHKVETTPEQYEERLEFVREQVPPWTRDSTGFRGLIGLFNRATGTTLVPSCKSVDHEPISATAVTFRPRAGRGG